MEVLEEAEVIEGESVIGRESVLLMVEETRKREGRLMVEETRRTEGRLLLLLVVGAGLLLLLLLVVGRLWIEIEIGSEIENKTGSEIETGKEKDGEVISQEVDQETLIQKTFVGHHQVVEAGAVLLLLLLDTETTSLRVVTETTGEIAAEAEAGIGAIRFRLILTHVEIITLHEKKKEMSAKTEATLGEDLLLLIHALQTVTEIESEIENEIENERRTSSAESESEILKSNMNKIENVQCLPLKNVKRIILHLLFNSNSSSNNNNLLRIAEIAPLQVREIDPI